MHHDSDKDEDVEKSGAVRITIKNDLPIYWHTKKDGNSKWHYSYGNAKFTKPDIGGDE